MVAKTDGGGGLEMMVGGDEKRGDEGRRLGSHVRDEQRREISIILLNKLAPSTESVSLSSICGV